MLPLLLVALLGVSLAACGGGASEPKAGSSSAASTELDPNATIRYATLPPAAIDPHRTTCACEIVHLGPVYETLVARDAGGRPVPGLAKSWEFSADGKTLTFHLQDGVTFHDGSPFNAEAVKANLDRALTLPESTVKGDLAAIEGVNAIDERTVQLNLKEPGASLPLILSNIAGMMVSPAALKSADLNTTMVGTGPYKLTTHETGRRMVFERFDGYWDSAKAAKAARIELMLNSDSTATFNALRSGQLDIASILPNEAKNAESLGFTIKATGGLGYYHLHLNRSLPPFDNVKVRQAMNFAIDRQAIFNALGFGFGGPTTEPFPPGYWAYSEEAANLYGYDPGKAKALLAEAGFNGNLAFDVIVPATPGSVKIAEAVKSQLGAIGVTVNINTVEGTQFAPTFFGGKTTIPVGILQWTGRPEARQTFSQLFTSQGYGNPGRHTTPEVEKLLAEANKPQESQDAEAKAVQAVTRQLMEQALDVPIYYYTAPLAYTGKVVGMEPWISGYINLRDLGLTTKG
ncbi:ABC transporter substrate-binding protein [Acrocarpospora macrocephala]|uniref:ABC transporter substrate-binding protein n=1 Tax=Acrocarpospora macrocephala TaxID=150177 RepID=A0A5M3WMI3_9ACTN|nr:ABC transporter substrate-binding protein [Acrocarpospora macrocephala]GES09369.1 ABC transporter substrate-binding protein [Acrocarpospora macrocephala]